MRPVPHEGAGRFPSCPSGDMLCDMGDSYDVTEEWATLRGWLDQHAPTSAALIRPGSSPDAIADAEAQVGMPFSDDVAAWFAAQGGGGRSFECELLPGQLPLGLEDALATHRVCAEVAAGHETLWTPALVPVGEDTCGGNYVVDLLDRVAPGSVRFHDFENDGEVPLRWPSLGALVADVRRALADGDVIGGHWQARAHDGVVEWRVIYGDTLPSSPWD
jgi:cell wall assembly regulator SMI1